MSSLSPKLAADNSRSAIDHAASTGSDPDKTGRRSFHRATAAIPNSPDKPHRRQTMPENPRVSPDNPFPLLAYPDTALRVHEIDSPFFLFAGAHGTKSTFDGKPDESVSIPPDHGISLAQRIERGLRRSLDNCVEDFIER